MWFRTVTYSQERSYPVMSLEESRRTQRPYRYGMILLCIGALINWVGLADNYPEPLRYVGIASIIAGTLLICASMCCWLHAPNRTGLGNTDENTDPIHVITVTEQHRREKPPDYETIEIPPPTYDDAIKLNPATLFTRSALASVPPVAICVSQDSATSSSLDITSNLSTSTNNFNSNNNYVNVRNSDNSKNVCVTNVTEEKEEIVRR